METIKLSKLAPWLSARSSSAHLVSGVSVDTRLLKSGNLFFALPGESVDGHAFLAEASRKGAAGAVVKRGYQGPSYGLPLLPVDEPLAALQGLAAALLERHPAKIIAVTGSVGKTTTKDFIAQILKIKYRVAASPGNSNSKIGLPLAVINHVRGDEEALVFEMGLSCAGDIAELVRIAPPDIAVITTVALVHAMNFNSLEDIARAKSEIFSSSKTTQGILHRGIVNFEEIIHAGSCHKASFSCGSSKADYALFDNHDGTITISGPGNEGVMMDKPSLPGMHNLHNMLAACAACNSFGMSWKEIKEGARSLKLPEKRMQSVVKNGALFINDAYNASLISMKAALDAMPRPEGRGRRFAVFGEMLELGRFSQQCHREVGEYALDRIDYLFCLGKECGPIVECWRAAGREVFFTEERADIVDALKRSVREQDVVLLKASRAKELWKVLEELCTKTE